MGLGISSLRLGLHARQSERFFSPLAREMNAVEPLSALPNQVMLEKLRASAGETEFAVYTPISADGTSWARRYYTNRFNTGITGCAREVAVTLARLYVSGIEEKHAINISTGTEATAPIQTQATADATSRTGTWVGPATTNGVTDTRYSVTVGDSVVYTVTGATRIALRAVNNSVNGGIGELTITESSVEIPEDNYLIQIDASTSRRLVNLRSGRQPSTGLAHVPLAKNLDPSKTYVVTIEVDASNPVGGRMYDSGLLEYDAIAYDAVGLHAVVNQTTGLGVLYNDLPWAGQVAVYEFVDVTRINWRCYKTTPVGQVAFTVYDSSGVEISTYTTETYDTYSGLGQAASVEVASGLARGTYYLHVEVLKTKNASSTNFRVLENGGIGYDETTGGELGVDTFEIQSMPTNPSSGSDIGTHVLSGNGNVELAIRVSKTGEATGDAEFVGGTHAFESSPANVVFRVDGVEVDYSGASNNATWIGSTINLDYDTELQFPSDSSAWADVHYGCRWTRAGYEPSSRVEVTTDARIYVLYPTMVHTPSRDPGGSYADDVGGGFDTWVLDGMKVETYADYDNTTVNEGPSAVGLIGYNDDYAISCVFQSSLAVAGDVIAVSRSDSTNKLYSRAQGFDFTNGVVVPTGTVYTWSQTYRVWGADAAAVAAAYYA